MITDSDPEVVVDPEVLPGVGTQWTLDWGYRACEFLKRQAIAVSVGVALGVLICYVINNKGFRK